MAREVQAVGGTVDRKSEGLGLIISESQSGKFTSPSGKSGD